MPGPTGPRSGSGSTAAIRTTRAARSCPTSTRRGCCPCSRPGRSCPGRSPGSCGGAGIIIAWLATIHWAYGRRPLAAALAVLVLAFPVGANLDTGNVTLLLALGLWVAQFCGARLAGLIWAIATWMKWFPAPFWLLLAPRARTWGLIWLAVGRAAQPADPAAHDHPAPGPVRLRAAPAPARLPGPAVGHRPVAVAPSGGPRPVRPAHVAGHASAWVRRRPAAARRRWTGDPEGAPTAGPGRASGRSSAWRIAAPADRPAKPGRRSRAGPAGASLGTAGHDVA